MFFSTAYCIFAFLSVTFSLSCLINKLDTSRVRKIKYDEMFMMVSVLFVSIKVPLKFEEFHSYVWQCLMMNQYHRYLTKNKKHVHYLTEPNACLK